MPQDNTTQFVPTPGAYLSVNNGGSSAYASAGFSVVGPIEDKIQAEYISGSPWGISWGIPRALPSTIDDLTREVAHDIYEAMEQSDPIISSSLKLLKISTLSGGLQVTSCVAKTPDDTADDPDEELGEEVAGYCNRIMKGLRRPIMELIYEFLDALHIGTKLGEHIYEVAEFGPDAGTEVLKDIKIKLRQSWRFVVDPFLNVDSIVAYRSDGLGTIQVARRKFAVMTHNPRNSDPRGTSILRSSNAAWNMKLLYWPLFYRFICLSAAPIPVGEVGPDARPRPANADDVAYYQARGMACPDVILPEHLLLRVVNSLQNGAGAAVGNGTKLSYLEAKSSGEVFINAVGLLNREVATGILLQTRATQEAEHGSKADSKTGHEVVGLFVQWLQSCVASFISQEIFYWPVCYRFGAEIADRLMPNVVLGSASQESLTGLMKAIADLERSGFIADSQRPTLDVELGLPQRKPEEIDRSAAVDPNKIAVAESGQPGVDIQPGEESKPKKEASK